MTTTTAVDETRELLRSLLNAGLLKTWYRDRQEGWTLVSGLWSPFYVQLRPLASHPELLSSVGRALAKLIRVEIPDASALVGIAMTGIPLAVAASLAGSLRLCYTRPPG